MLWLNKRYYTNNRGEWNFLPPEHRPGGTRALHDDLTWPFNKIPRTYTSFIFNKFQIFGIGNITPERYFEWDIEIYKFRIPYAWQEQVTMIGYKDPFGKFYEKLYKCHRIGSYLYRTGPRISEGWEGGKIKYCYVDWMPGPNFLTFGCKRLEV